MSFTFALMACAMWTKDQPIPLHPGQSKHVERWLETLQASTKALTILMAKLIVWVIKASDPHHSLPYSGFP